LGGKGTCPHGKEIRKGENLGKSHLEKNEKKNRSMRRKKKEHSRQ